VRGLVHEAALVADEFRGSALLGPELGRHCRFGITANAAALGALDYAGIGSKIRLLEP